MCWSWKTAKPMPSCCFLSSAVWGTTCRVSAYGLPAGCARLSRDAPGIDLPFIISGTIGEETAHSALHAGADDFLVKGNLARSAPAIERELQEHALRIAHRRAEERYRRVIGMHKMLKRLLGEDLGLSLLTSQTLGKVHADPGQLEQII